MRMQRPRTALTDARRGAGSEEPAPLSSPESPAVSPAPQAFRGSARDLPPHEGTSLSRFPRGRALSNSVTSSRPPRDGNARPAMCHVRCCAWLESLGCAASQCVPRLLLCRLCPGSLPAGCRIAPVPCHAILLNTGADSVPPTRCRLVFSGRRSIAGGSFPGESVIHQICKFANLAVEEKLLWCRATHSPGHGENSVGPAQRLTIRARGV